MLNEVLADYDSRVVSSVFYISAPSSKYNTTIQEFNCQRTQKREEATTRLTFMQERMKIKDVGNSSLGMVATPEV